MIKRRKRIVSKRKKKPMAKKTRAGSQHRSVKKTEITEDTELLPMEQKFCDEFLLDFNQTNAAIRAGYSPTTAKNIASRLRKQVNVSAYIARKIAETSTRNGIEFDRIMRECARIAFVNPLSVFDVESGRLKDMVSDDDAAAIQGLKVKHSDMGEMGSSTEREVKFHAKDKALDIILKYARASEEFNQKIAVEKEKLALEKRKLDMEERRLALLEAEAEKEKKGSSIILNILDPFGDNDENVSEIIEKTPDPIVQNDGGAEK